MPKTGFKVLTVDDDTYEELNQIAISEGVKRRPETLRMIVREWKMFKHLVLGKVENKKEKNEQTVILSRNQAFSSYIPSFME